MLTTRDLEKLQQLRRTPITTMLCALLVIILSSASVSAQSTDRNNPTPLTSSEVSSASSATLARGNYYYSFMAGPGEVTLVIEGKSLTELGTSFTAQVLDASGNQLTFTNIAAYNRITARSSVVRFQLARRQSLLLNIALEENVAEYIVRLGGAIQLTEPAAPTRTDIPPSGSTTTTPPRPNPMPSSSVRDNENFLRRLYRDTLGREIDAGTLRDLTNAMSAGSMTRADIVRRVLSSTEYRAKMVSMQFRQFIGREIDKPTLDNFVSLMERGSRIEDIIYYILISDPYYMRR